MRYRLALLTLALAACSNGHGAGVGSSSTTAPRMLPNVTTPADATVHPRVSVTPAEGLMDGQVVTVKATGFGVGGKVWLSECASLVDVPTWGEYAPAPFGRTSLKWSSSH